MSSDLKTKPETKKQETRVEKAKNKSRKIEPVKDTGNPEVKRSRSKTTGSKSRTTTNKTTLQELKAENAFLRASIEKEKSERKKIEETTLRQAQELTLLERVRATIASKLELPALLRSVVESVVEVYGYTHVSVYLVEGEALHLQYQAGYKKVIERISLNEGISGRVARTGQPVLIRDVKKDPEFIKTGDELSSEITVPLLDDDHVIGTLSVESKKELTEADLNILIALSVDVGVAIGRAQLYEDVQRRNRTLSAVQESTLAIMGQLGLPDAIQAILAQAAQLINTEHGYLYLVQPNGMLQMMTGMGIYPKYIGMTLEKGEGLAGKVWKFADPLISNDYIHWEGRSSKFDGMPFHAVIGVPLVRNSEVTGVLGLAHLNPGNTFTKDDVELLARLAQLASIAIENAALYTQVHQELAERKQADERLRASEERLAAVMEGSQLGYSDWNIQTGKITRNERWANMLGYSLQDIESTFIQWNDLLHPDDKAKAVKSLQDHLEGKTPIHRDEYRLRTKDGSYRWILDQGRIIEYDAHGRPLRMTATHTDITERKQAEQALSESEEKYRNLVEHTPAVVYLDHADLEGTNFYISPQVEHLFGYPISAFAENPTIWHDMIHPDDYEHATASIVNTLKNGQTIEEYRVISKDGKELWVRDTSVLIRDEFNQSKYIQGFLEDITERKRAEEAFRKSEQRLQAFFNQSLDGFFFCDFGEPVEWKHARNKDEMLEYIISTKQFTDVNDAMLKQYGIKREGFLRLTTKDIFAHDPQQGWNLRRELFDKGHLHLETYERTVDGTPVWFEGDYVCLYDAQERITGFFGIQRDITDRKQADTALRESEKHLEEAQRIAHLGSWTWTAATDTPFWSRELCAILEVEPDQPVTSLAEQDKLFTADSMAKMRAAIKKTMDTGEPYEIELEGTRRDGTQRWLLARGERWYNEQWEVIGLRGTALEITERKQTENELQRHIQNTLTIYELSQNIHTSLDLDLVYQETHKAIQKLMPCDAFLIALLDNNKQLIDDVYLWDQGKRWPRDQHPIGEGLTNYILSTGRPLFVNEWTDEHTQLTNTLQFGDIEQDTHSVLAVPLFAMDGSCFGVMTAQAYPTHAYTSEHEQLIITLANQVSKAIENANLFAEVQQELTERKRTEQALRESEGRYRTLFSGMLDGVYRSTHDGKFVDVNPAMVKMFGYSSREEMLSIEIKKDLYFSPEERNSLFLDTGQEKVDEFRMKRKDGSEIWVEDHGHYVHDEQGNVIYHEGILRDITERKKAEDALKRSEAFTKSIVENEPECVKIVGAGGILQYMNPAGLSMIEADSLEPLVGKSVYPIIAPKDRKAFIELTEKVLKGEQGTLRFEVVGLKGTRRWLDTHAVPLYDEHGKVTALMGLTRDITERMRAAEAVREAEEKYRSIFENSAEGIYQSSPDGRFFTVNPAFASMMGYSSPQEMMLAITDIEQQLYSDIYRRKDFVRQLEEQGSITGFEYQIRRKDGKLIWVSENARLVRNTDGSVSYYEGFLEDISARKQNEQRIDNQLKQLNALHAIDNAINSNFDLRTTLDVVLREVIAQLRADATSVLLFNKETHTLDYTAGRGFISKATQHTKLSIGEGYAGRVILDRKMVHIPDLTNTENNRLTNALNTAGENFVAYVGSPLVAKGQVVGVLEIFQRAPLAPNPDWFDFLTMIADQAAIAIDNAQLFENLQRSNFDLTLAYDATIEGWSRALDLRDRETEGHTQRVTNLTVKLARQMGIPDTDILHIRRGALLHDIGKMGIPDSILHKPDQLTPEEWEIMRQHTKYAYQMLTPIKYLKPALDIPRHHHEKWDGTGYPEGVKGEQIPIAARIFAVVDVWDALTSDRSYRDAWSREKVIEYIRSESGKHFDPRVVETFLSFILNEPL